MSFEQTLRAAGLRPRDVVADGKWRRCPTEDHPRKRNGAYRLEIGGLRGWWRNWAIDSGLNYWADSTGASFRAVDERKLEEQRQRDRRRRIECIHGARSFWNRAEACTRLHPYLADKGLSALGTAGLREAEGLLVVPVLWKGNVISLQTIHPSGQKRFWTGAPVKGGCFVMERPHAAVTAIVEGLATGLAVFQCVKQARVLVAFDAGNLLPVVDAQRPTGSVVICADNDHGTFERRGFNPGIDKANNAAELIGAGVAYPEGIEGTDWADALKEWGQPGVKRIERMILAGAQYVVPP